MIIKLLKASGESAEQAVVSIMEDARRCDPIPNTSQAWGLDETKTSDDEIVNAIQGLLNAGESVEILVVRDEDVSIWLVNNRGIYKRLGLMNA